MSFTDAIRDGFSKYATFTGRSSRSAYWWWYLFSMLTAVIVLGIDMAIGTGGVLYALVAIALLLPSLAVTVRRLHDTGRSGWWILIALIPIVGGIVLLVFTLLASEPPNKWGNGPDQQPSGASALA